MSIQLLKRALIATLFMSSGFLLFPQIATAKSGCCSSHDGVNCSAGPQANGNVICNDGWSGSSCAYSEMVMCGGNPGSNEIVQQEPVQQQAQPVIYISPTAFPTRVPTRVPTKNPTPTSTPPPMPTSTSAPTKISEEIRHNEEGIISLPEPTPPPTAEETAIGLGIMGGMGYGAYWGGKKLFVKLLQLFR